MTFKAGNMLREFLSFPYLLWCHFACEKVARLNRVSVTLYCGEVAILLICNKVTNMLGYHQAQAHGSKVDLRQQG